MTYGSHYWLRDLTYVRPGTFFFVPPHIREKKFYLGVMLKKWQEHSFVSDNTCEAIAENRSAQLDKSDSIQKRKRLETTY